MFYLGRRRVRAINLPEAIVFLTMSKCLLLLSGVQVMCTLQQTKMNYLE